MPCMGAPTQLCGGHYLLNAFKYEGSASVCAGAAPAVGTGTTPSATGSVSNPSASVTRSMSANSAAATGSSTVSASAPAASATGSTGTVTTEWESIGCFLDNPNLTNNVHILKGTSLTGQKNMTPGLCQARCAKQGYNFAGLEYGQGTSIFSHHSSRRSSVLTFVCLSPLPFLQSAGVAT